MGKITPRFLLAVFIFGLYLLSANTVLANINYGPEKPMFGKEIKHESFFVGFLLQEEPTITAPSDINVVNEPGECFALKTNINLGNASFSGTTNSPSNDAPASFQLGETTVTWTVTDDAGNTATDTQKVTVEDNEVPTITAPADLVIDSDTGSCEATNVSLGSSTTNDNCGVDSVVNNAPASFPLGETTVTWTVTDDAGNSATDTQKVTIEDNEVPTITAPADLVIDSDTGSCEATNVSLGSSTTNDNCGVDSVENDAPASFPLGETTITWTVTDDAGNTATDTQTVTVEDNEVPTITAPADLVIDSDTGSCDATNVSLGSSTTNDNCGVDSVENDAPSAFPLGVTTVTWTVTDDAGNSATDTQTVTVEDNEVPTITAPADLVIDSDTGSCDATNVSLGSSTTNDNCGVNSVENDAPTAFPLGEITVTWTVTDDAGNIATDTQKVTVEDNEVPTITAPADLVIDSDTGSCDATNVSLGSSTTNDNCGVDSVENDAPVSFPLGETTVTWTVTDDAGNIATDTQKVTVEDNEAPTITAPADLVLDSDTGSCDATNVSLGSSTTNDNCGVKSVINDAPSTFPLGTTTVTWTVTDNADNISTDTQTVTVEDNELPTIIAPDDLIVDTDFDQCSASAINLGTPATNDNCGIKEVKNDAPNTFPIGVTTVTWTVIDNADNANTITQKVIVEDTQAPSAPVLTDLVSECPLTVTPPTTEDNCDGTITATTGITDFTFDESGSVFWTFTDAAGNQTGPIEQKVIINNNVAPVPDASSLPPFTINGCQISSISELQIPTATDACEGPILGTLSEGFEFPYSFSGTNTIEWQFIDSKGNISTQTQEIELVPLKVDGGNLTGTFQSEVFQEQIDISACGEAISIELDLAGENGNIVHWEKYSVNKGVWEIITNTNDSYNVNFAEGELISTFYRVLIKTGTCSEYSNSFYIRALPVGDAPTVENLEPERNNKYCLGDEVKLLAKSNYTATQPALPDEAPGDFNQGNAKGWSVDGSDKNNFTAGGNSKQPRNWSGTNDHEFGNITYDGGDKKFAIAQGDFSDNKYKGNDPTTLESPILDFSNAEAASLDFDQAFYFADQDLALIEISTNGGNTYTTLRVMHTPGSGVKKWFTAGTAESYVGSNATNYNFSTDNTSIALDDYIGESNVKIRWTFRGTDDNSVWAMDNIVINKEIPVDTELEWTDGIGDPNEDPIVVGRTEVPINFTPTVPGQHEYGGTALINGCRTYSEEGTDLINISVSYSYAGENIELSNDECGKNTVQLNAYDNTLTANENNAKGAYPTMPSDCRTCDDPGTGEIGTWSWSRVSGTSNCVTESFSNPNDPNATFTGNEGTYTLTWTVDGCSNSITAKIKECNEINFDGVNDYIDFGADNYDLSNSTNKKAFSIEVWIKPESVNGTQTIFSKRDANYSDNSKGYDLTIENGELSFNWNNNGTIDSSPYELQTNRWHHVGITHSVSGEYKLYVDGVLIKSTSGGSPGENTSRAILGAVDQTEYEIPTHYFNGWMEELRVWNVALTSDQLREMMNQRITQDGTSVSGEILELKIDNLNWEDLIGYYRMDNIECSSIYPYNNGSDVGFPGKLRNITTPQQRSAPLPYESDATGDWHTRNSWDPNSTKYWTFPNDEGINGDPINWNIARQKHNLNSNNKDIKLLALFSETGTELIMEGVNNNSGNELRITRYLDLSGYIDLKGESQLVQTEGSILDGTGSLERDQQGTASSFNYNYWSSPVLPNNNSTTYKVNEILHDGSTIGTKAFKSINFKWPHTHADGPKSNPIKISDYWINAFRAKKANEYSQWEQIGSYTALKPGEGYTMKGTEDINISEKKLQNYTFNGFPNNGIVEVSEIKAEQNYLLGNPYPSSISVEEFILDNIKDGEGRNDKNLLNGAVYFWDHFSGKTHYLAKYVGGYATRNLLDGVPAISNDSRINATGAQGNKRPGAYIPVAQGFFVNTTQDAQAGSIDNFDTGKIIFKNSQRYFRSEETESISVFMEEKNMTQKSRTNQSKKTDSRFKIRLKFNSPTGYHREISVGADARTSQGFDLGFDARLLDRGPEDMYWMIDKGRFVIQGVPHFNLDQRLPLGITIAEEKEFSIELGELENVPDIIDIYLRDNSDSTYYDLRKEAFKASLPAGEYQDLYEIVFHDVTSTRKDKEPGEGPIDYYYSLDNREFVISNPELHKIEHINIYNIAGQLVDQHFGIPDLKEIHVPQKKSLSSAVYIVKVYTDSGDYAKKVIIRKD